MYIQIGIVAGVCIGINWAIDKIKGELNKREEKLEAANKRNDKLQIDAAKKEYERKKLDKAIEKKYYEIHGRKKDEIKEEKVVPEQVIAEKEQPKEEIKKKEVKK